MNCAFILYIWMIKQSQIRVCRIDLQMKISKLNGFDRWFLLYSQMGQYVRDAIIILKIYLGIQVWIFEVPGKVSYLYLVVVGMIGWGVEISSSSFDLKRSLRVRTISMVSLSLLHPHSRLPHSLTPSPLLFPCRPPCRPFRPNPLMWSPPFTTTTNQYSLFQLACLPFQNFIKLHLLLLSMAPGYSTSGGGLIPRPHFLHYPLPPSCKWVLRKPPLGHPFWWNQLARRVPPLPLPLKLWVYQRFCV